MIRVGKALMVSRLEKVMAQRHCGSLFLAHIRALGRWTDWSEALLHALSQGSRLTEALPCANCVLGPHHGSFCHDHWKGVEWHENWRAARVDPGSGTRLWLPLHWLALSTWLPNCRWNQFCAYKKGDADSVEEPKPLALSQLSRECDA